MGRLSPAGFRAVDGLRRTDVTPFWRAHAKSAVWAIVYAPSESPELRCCPSSLYTFSAGISPGLARDRRLRFPRV
jgi:hypothetical protein